MEDRRCAYRVTRTVPSTSRPTIFGCSNMDVNKMDDAKSDGGLKSSSRGHLFRQKVSVRSGPILCIASCLVVGCATQSETGASIGAIAGAVIGKSLGGDRGAIVGAALGGAIGYNIGKNMDEADRKKLAEAKARATAANLKQTFYSPSVKAQVVVEPGKAYPSPKKQQLVFDNDTQVVPMTVLVDESQPAYVDTPIYFSPDYGRPPKLLATKGAAIRRIAVVDGTDWYVVGQGEYGLGYVHKDYFDQKIIAATAGAAETARQEKLAALAEQMPKKNDGPKKVVKPAKVPQPVKPATVDATTATASVSTSMLDSTALTLPPAAHFSTPKMNAADFATTATTGANKADAVKQGNKAYLVQTKLVGASTECRELVTTLLQDDKAVATEKSSTCSTTKGWT